LTNSGTRDETIDYNFLVLGILEKCFQILVNDSVIKTPSFLTWRITAEYKEARYAVAQSYYRLS